MGNLTFQCLSYNPKDSISTDIGIDENRMASLVDEMGDTLSSVDTVSAALSAASKLAETPQELAWMSYMIGRAN